MSLVNKRELAEIVGKTERTLTSWMQDGMPVYHQGGRGKETHFETAEVIAWMLQREVAGYLPKDEDGKEIVYEVERARLTKAQADHEELKVQVLSGTLIPSTLVEAVQGGMVTSFRARMLSLPTKAASALASTQDEAEGEAVLTDLVHEALEELADFDPDQYAAVPPDSADGPAAAEADDQSVGGSKSRPKQRERKRARPVAH